jgi:hypothetical protein
LALLGVVALIGGWIGSSRTVFPFEQMPFVISGGFVGLSLIVAGAASWVSADLRDAWRKVDELEETIRATSGSQSRSGR